MRDIKNINPIYIYGFGVVLTAALFIFFSQPDAKNAAMKPAGISNQEMPDDNIHKGLQGNSLQPNKDNVMETVKQHLEMLKKNVEENPADTMKIKQYADFLAAVHQPDEALVYYEKILKVNPNREDVLFSEAYINYSKRNFNDAEKYLERVLSFDKNNLNAYYNLGAIAAGRGDKVKAKEIWSKLINEHPKDQISEMAKKSLNSI